MIGLVNLIQKDDKGNVKVPVEFIEFENRILETKDQITIEYILKDGSSIIVCYTKKEDFIIKRKSANVTKF